MALSDSDSDSSCSSDDSSVEGYDLKPKFDPYSTTKKGNLSPSNSKNTYDMTVSDSDDDSSDDDDDSDDNSFDGNSVVSEITMGTFMTAHSRDGDMESSAMKIPESIRRTTSLGGPRRGKRGPSKTGAPERSSSLDLSAAEEAIRMAEEQTRRLRETMDSSVHSMRSSEEAIQFMAKCLEDDIYDVDNTIDDMDFSKIDLSKKLDDMDDKLSVARSEADESFRSIRTAETRASQASIAIEKRRKEKMERLARIKDKIKDKKYEEENKAFKEKQSEIASKMAGVTFDMSEKARLGRIYEWYTRSGMPPKAEFIDKVSLMPASAGVTEEDVELLPWAKNGKWINAAKVTSMLYRKD